MSAIRLAVTKVENPLGWQPSPRAFPISLDAQFSQGSLNATHLGGNETLLKCMVNLKDFPLDVRA